LALVEEFVDNGVSGAKGRDTRPAFDRLCKAVTCRKIDVVAAWSVDRLGRSLQDLVGFLGELNGAGCDLYLERQAVDTTTPSGRALFQMLAVFANSNGRSFKDQCRHRQGARERHQERQVDRPGRGRPEDRGRYPRVAGGR
jgi:DNA invertase Pin-like site-specific DNA recombinase